jgi:hypothetical protein
MLRRVFRLLLRESALLTCLVLAGCGGGDEVDCAMVMAKGAPPATVPVVSLSAEQRAQLCDVVACQNGGYDHQHACSSGPPVTFAGSRAQCLAQWPSNPDCRATVHDLTACMQAISASPCASTFLGSAACEEVTAFECLTFRPNAASAAMMTVARSLPSP